jgi:hypothetical protein
MIAKGIPLQGGMVIHYRSVQADWSSKGSRSCTRLYMLNTEGAYFEAYELVPKLSVGQMSKWMINESEYELHREEECRYGPDVATPNSPA